MSETKQLVGPKVTIMGLGGVGKTFCLGTLVDWAEKNGFEVAILFTENSLETLLGYWRDRNLPVPACLYYHQQGTRPVSLKAMMAMADIVGKVSYEGVTKQIDPERQNNNAFFKILASLSNFVDDRTGKTLGNIDQWPPTRILGMDSLTATANAAMKMQVGSRPTASPGDYGVSQGALMNLLRYLTEGLDCPFVMTAHVDRELEPVTGTTKTMIKAIGKALATEIPTLFSDVIYAMRDGANFTWSTAEFGVDTKTRSLGYRSKIDPNFGPLMDLWIKRRGQA